MTASSPLPLSASVRQQALLQTISACYENDDRIRALLIFGSFGQDRGDEYSDLDLEVVMRDDVTINMADEIERVRLALATFDERVLFTEIAGNDGYLVVESLYGIAISYHALKSMSPYVLEGWHVFIGSLDAETVCAVASANLPVEPSLSQHVHRALWLALGVDMIVQRRQFWRALLGLERLRSALAEIFAASRNGKRAYQIFEEQASPELQAKFAPTFPRYFADSPTETVHSLGSALLVLLDLIEHDLDEISNGQAQLGSGERDFISRLRARTMLAISAPA
jgi:predicted nucleotidyltransferase